MEGKRSSSKKSSKKRHRSKKDSVESVVVPKIRRTYKRINYCEDSSSDELEKAEVSQIENRPHSRSTSVVETFKSEIRRNSSDEFVDVDTIESDSSETNLDDKIVKTTSRISYFSETSNQLDVGADDTRIKTDSVLSPSPKKSSESSLDLSDDGENGDGESRKIESGSSWSPNSSDASKSGSSDLSNAGENADDENSKTTSRASSSPSSLEICKSGSSDLSNAGENADDENSKTSSSPSSLEICKSGSSPDLSDVGEKADNQVLKKPKYPFFPNSSDYSFSGSSPDLLDAGPIGNNELQKTSTSSSNSPNSPESGNSSPFPRWGQNVLKRTDSLELFKDEEPHEKCNTEVQDESVRNNSNATNTCGLKTEWEKWRARAIMKKQIEEMKELRLKEKDQVEKSEKELEKNLPGQKFSTLLDVKKDLSKGQLGYSEDNQKHQNPGSEKVNNRSELNKTAKVAKEIPGKESTKFSTSLLGQTKTSNIDMEVISKKHRKEGSTENITDMKFSLLPDPKKAIPKRSFGYSEDHQKNKSPRPVDKLSGSSKSVEITKEIPSKESKKAYTSLLNQIKDIKRSKIDDTEAVSKKIRDGGSNENIPNMTISPVPTVNPKRRSDPNDALKENRQRTSL